MAVMVGNRRGGPNSGAPFPVPVNEYNEQIVAQGLPPFADLVRSNSGWSSMAVLAIARTNCRTRTNWIVLNSNPPHFATCVADGIDVIYVKRRVIRAVAL